MSFRLTTAGAVIIVALTGGSAVARQSLELQLQPTQSTPTAKAASRDTVQLASRASVGRSLVRTPIGKVGYVTAAGAAIRRSTSANSRTLWNADKGMRLAVVNTSGSWYGVLMKDGSTGWISSGHIEISDLRVVAEQGAGTGNQMIDFALTYAGTPYVWGGNTRSGIDCSGLVKAVWGQFGRSLPRTAREQATVGLPVAIDQLEAGDRLYWNFKGGAIDHTGIYMGNGSFVHSSVGRGGVGVDSLITSPKYMKAFVCARRG